ncbi:MAG: hypothetical protein K0S55_388 [Clostridia bacterium]|jgi:hypothetical protein|nr:hypothetical protein [Clostridia bacterium]
MKESDNMLLKIIFQDICYFIMKKPLIFFLYLIALIAGEFTVIYISAILDRSFTDEIMAKTPYIVMFSKPQPSNSVYDILKKYRIDNQKDSSVYIFNNDSFVYNEKYIHMTARDEDPRVIEEKYSYTKTPNVPGIIGYRENGRLKSPKTLYISGRGFEDNDNDKNNILVSDNLYTFIENESITLDNMKFNVIGVRVGFSYIDNSFLLDYNRFNQLNIPVKAVQIIFAYAPMSDFINKMSDEFSVFDPSSEILKGDTFGIQTIISFLKNVFLNILVILAVFLSCLSLVSCWFQANKRIIGIYSLCGAKKSRLSFLIYFQNFLYILFTYLISAVIFLFLSGTNYKRFVMHPNFMLIILCFIFLIMISTCFIFLLRRKDINSIVEII